MGDMITDLPKEPEIPPLPPKTYQWEDVRRQKLEGRYPWTHLHKPPFNDKNWDKTKDHEYEPVIPMDGHQTQSSFVKITLDQEMTTSITQEFELETPQNKNHLCVPDKNVYEDDEDDDDDSSETSEDVSEEITAEELQLRLEEKYFRQSPSSSKQEYELTETRSVSPVLVVDDGQNSSKPNTPGLQRKLQLQADKIKQKFKNFKDQISNEQVESSPRVKRKNKENTKTQKWPKKNKFNFRKHNVKLPSTSNFHVPRAANLSFLSLPSFSRSRSSSIKERERKRSYSSEADASKKKFEFNFSTYPRNIFSKKKKLDDEKTNIETKVKQESASSSPGSRRSPFPRWINKLKENKNDEKMSKNDNKNRLKKNDKTKDTIVQESIFISLHEDAKSKITPEMGTQNDNSQMKMKIDNENFIFISLHEERFPEKIKNTKNEMSEEELEIEKEIKKAQTARKFHSMLKRLETERKLKARQLAEQDDGPEPVIITEITNNEENQNGYDHIQETTENKIEIPEEVEHNRSNVENVPPEKFKFEDKEPAVETKTSSMKNEKIKTNRQCISNNDTSTDEVVSQENIEKLNKINPVLITPFKTPRKKLRQPDLEKESKESLYDFQDSSFKEALILNEHEIITKTYIKDSLEEISTPLKSAKPEQTIQQFNEYEKALEKSKCYSSIEIENQCYTSINSLARLETPVPPNRPSRGRTLVRRKRGKTVDRNNKENVYTFELTNQNYNTFPVTKPDKPRRKFKKCRTYSNSTNNTDNTDIKNIDELEDDTINKNIINSKQLSISFLPLTSNIVGEPITQYNLRETSSMVHLNLRDPPLPPKRRRAQYRTDINFNYNSLPNHRYTSKRSIISSEIPDNIEINANDDELDYADDVNSTVPDSDSPPKRPSRKRSAVPSTVDEDRTSREIESLPSEKSIRDDTDFCEFDTKDTNPYAVIGKPSSSLVYTDAKNSQQSIIRRKNRRISDFFTLPRIRVPTNYVSPVFQTLDHRRLPSPTRPPRRTRSFRQTVYKNDKDNTCVEHVINFDEQLNFDLATEEDDFEEKNLKADDVLQKMKSRPLPPPPRPIRKSKDIEEKNAKCNDYSQCNKNKKFFENNLTNNLSERITIEEKIINTTSIKEKSEISSKNLFTNECSNFNTRSDNQSHFSLSKSTQRCNETETIKQESNFKDLSCSGCIEKFNHTTNFIPSVDQSVCREANGRTEEHCSTNVSNLENSTKINQSLQIFQNLPTNQFLNKTNKCSQNERIADVITASKLNVSELKVSKLSVDEIESSRLRSSNIECSSMQVSNIKSDADNLVFNTIDFSSQHFPDYLKVSKDEYQMQEITDTRDGTPSSEDVPRERISSMVPEIGSDNEINNSITKVVRPSRRKQSFKKEVSVTPTVTESNRATLAELMCQILQICHSSVGQAIHSLLEQLIPEDREKRNEVQTAIWVITIIVAGCLMLGLQNNEKIVHHHHWDFHFPPPH